MKKQYISPESEVFECKTDAMLMASAFSPSIPNPIITPTDDEEISGDINGRSNGYDW